MILLGRTVTGIQCNFDIHNPDNVSVLAFLITIHIILYFRDMLDTIICVLVLGQVKTFTGNTVNSIPLGEVKVKKQKWQCQNRSFRDYRVGN